VASGNYGYMIDKLVDHMKNDDQEFTNFSPTVKSNKILKNTSINNLYNVDFALGNGDRNKRIRTLSDDKEFNIISSGSDGAIPFREPLPVSESLQFRIILRKTIKCILRDRVGILQLLFFFCNNLLLVIFI